MKTNKWYNTQATILNKIPDLIECTDHCHSIGLIKGDGTVEVYANHMDGFEFIQTFKTHKQFKEVFDIDGNICEIDIEFIKDIKKKIPDTTEILYWVF